MKKSITQAKIIRLLSAHSFTNPDRILFPEQGINKIELAYYYATVQDWILPFIVNRPLSIVRCPKGEQKKCFYQKHIVGKLPESIYKIPIQEKNELDEYIYIQNISGLLSLVQMGTLEIHPWGSNIKQVEKPDYIVFDLDPSPDVEWIKVIEAAYFIKEHLELLQLKSFVKTSGGKGLHVVIPIKPIYDWSTIKDFTEKFAKLLAKSKSQNYTATMSKTKRQGKIFIDYFRNQRGATTIAPYSTRIKPEATVSTPLAWEELSTRIHSNHFNIKNLPKRLTSLKKDPWEKFFQLKQKLGI